MSAFPIASGRRTWQEIRRVSRGHRLRLLMVLLLGLVSAALTLVMPAVLGRLIDAVSAGTADLGTVLIAVALMIGASAAGAAGTAVTVVIATRSYHSMLALLREQLVARALELSQHRVETAGTGDLISRTSDDVAEVADAAPQIIPAFTTVVFTILATLGGVAALDWRFGVGMLIAVPVYILTMRWYLRTGPRIYRAERMAMSGRAQQILESQRGFDTVLGFGIAEQRHDRVLQAAWAVAPFTVRTRTVQSMFMTRLNVAEFLGLAVLLLVGFLLVGEGQASVGVVTTAVLLLLRLFGPVNQLLFVIDTLQSALASLTRMVGVIAMGSESLRTSGADAPAPHGASGATSEPRHAGSVRAASMPAVEMRAASLTAASLHAVTFSYGGPDVLADVDLEIREGEHVAVVGASGAGKSTLAGVLAGIHEPTSGSVERPEATAVITQEFHVFAGSLRDNLTLGAPDAEDAKLHEAVRTAGAQRLLEGLADGLDTEVGGTTDALTPAQAQQVALARVLLVAPDLVVLDEATAEAGSAHAGVLDRAAEAAMRGRTAVVIAHRLSQAAVCDRVVVLEHGRIAEQGTHDELRTADGVYSRLWSAWEQGRGGADPR